MRRRRGEVIVVPEDGWDETPLSDADAPAWQDDLFAAAPTVDELLARRGEEPAFIDQRSSASISSAEPRASVLEEPPFDPFDDLAFADALEVDSDPLALAQAPTALEPEAAAAEREPKANLPPVEVEPASLAAVDPLDEQVGAEQSEPESVVLSAAPGLDPVVAAEALQVHEPEPALVELLVLPPVEVDPEPSARATASAVAAAPASAAPPSATGTRLRSGRRAPQLVGVAALAVVSLSLGLAVGQQDKSPAGEPALALQAASWTAEAERVADRAAAAAVRVERRALRRKRARERRARAAAAARASRAVPVSKPATAPGPAPAVVAAAPAPRVVAVAAAPGRRASSAAATEFLP